jgi:RNA polymerase sigma-70 factor (ECF subfamily)
MESRERKGSGEPAREGDLEARTRELFESWRRGDAAAAAALFELHHDALVEFVGQELGAKLRGKVEPEDVAQEVGLRLLHYEPKAEDGPADRFRALLRQMVRHAAADVHRRHFETRRRGGGRERPLPSDSLAPDQPLGSVTSPSRAFDRDEERSLARLVVHFLPGDRGDLIGLRSWLDVPFAELSARFGAEENALRMRLLRAMEKAAAVLAKLRGALPRLGADDRDLIELRVGRDLSFAAMGTLLGATPVGACARFQQAMRRLGGLIEEPFRPLPDDWPHSLVAGE